MLKFRPKGILSPIFIVCCLFICEKAFAVNWGEDCCEVYYFGNRNKIKIYYKFFEYDINNTLKNSFLERFEIQYSTDGGRNYIHLMSTSTEEQGKAKNWSFIEIQRKKKGEKIDLLFYPYDESKPISMYWPDQLETKLYVKNHTTLNNQTWLCVDWLRRRDQNKITQIRIWGIWYENGVQPIRYPVIVYNIDQANANPKLNSNSLTFYNLPHKHEIKTEDKIKMIKICKKTNTMVIKGAELGENIKVFTTTGKLVKSMVTDCDLFQIPLPMDQLYIVQVGQGRYKLAL